MKRITKEYIELDPVVEILGGKAALAETLGLERANVTRWVSLGYIPAKHTKETLKAVKAKKRKLDNAYKRITGEAK